MRRMSDLNCITMRLLKGLSLRTGLGHKHCFWKVLSASQAVKAIGCITPISHGDGGGRGLQCPQRLSLQHGVADHPSAVLSSCCHQSTGKAANVAASEHEEMPLRGCDSHSLEQMVAPSKAHTNGKQPAGGPASPTEPPLSPLIALSLLYRRCLTLNA
jgi:hypothetical protein